MSQFPSSPQNPSTGLRCSSTSALPAHMLHFGAIPTSTTTQRYARSRVMRATQYSCFPYYKAISRPFPADQESAQLPNPAAKHGLSADSVPVSGSWDGMHFMLYANCVTVRGARRSLICDLLLHRYQLIPNRLQEILSIRPIPVWEALRASTKEEDQDCLRRYFVFLEQSGYGFWTRDPGDFPPLDNTYHEAASIANAVVEISIVTHPYLPSVFMQLDQAGCTAIQLVFADTHSSPSMVEDVLALCATGRLRTIEVILRDGADWNETNVRELVERYQRVASMTFTRSCFHTLERVKPLNTVIRHVLDDWDRSRCGYVTPSFFSVTLKHYNEARVANSCLNRKISVNASGSISGCPCMIDTCGSVATTPLIDALRSPALVTLAKITKDQVAVCKDCEFRLICTDCRVYRATPALDAKPSHCTYDPYEATWK